MPVYKQFGDLFREDKGRLYSYIHALVADKVAADDIFQETCLTLWTEFAKFEIGTSFSKWANAIAYRRVLAFYRTNKKYTLGLDEDFLVDINEGYVELETSSTQLEQKLHYLELCLQRLSTPLQQVYEQFYVKNHTANEIASDSGRSIHAIRKVVHKIRQRIFDCVDEKAQQEDLL
ncbi:sigma-70 family RNA polymerase sigma factor [Catenovulum agarivorans]|uniref:sigma-70 family RNA polymerase sigma factor n=1 Tax=Catenovulum agarivorans TaxID=1172192 RepID=UPI00037C0039|nr:sigma-70 family RNA polymerase sigma factor [Catenovulum agarivorans]